MCHWPCASTMSCLFILQHAQGLLHLWFPCLGFFFFFFLFHESGLPALLAVCATTTSANSFHVTSCLQMAGRVGVEAQPGTLFKTPWNCCCNARLTTLFCLVCLLTLQFETASPCLFAEKVNSPPGACFSLSLVSSLRPASAPDLAAVPLSSASLKQLALDSGSLCYEDNCNSPRSYY